MWKALTPFIDQANRVIAVDLRGHGDSAVPPGPYSMAELAADVIDTLDDAGISSAHVLGISLGGMIAQQLALDAPDRVRSITVACSTAGPVSNEVWSSRVEEVLAGKLPELAETIASRWLTPEAREAEPELFEALRAGIAATPMIGYAAGAAAVRDFDLSARLHAIKAPTMVMAGELDTSMPLEHSQAIAAGIAGAQLVVLIGAAHLPVVENPRACAAPFLRFLGQI